MERQPINSEEYIKKVEETEFKVTGDELEESVARVSRPFRSLKITEDGVEINERDFRIKIEYGPHIYLRDGEEHVEKSSKIIISLIIESHDGLFNLLDILPQGTKIIVYPDSDREHGHVTYSDERGIRDIVIQGQINSPKMIAILLHEIGHVVDFDNLSKFGLEKGVDEGSNSDIAEEIRRERVATAFTLRLLKPFLVEKTTRQDMLNFLKHDALETYYSSAKEKMRKRKGGTEKKVRMHGFDDYDYYNEDKFD